MSSLSKMYKSWLESNQEARSTKSSQPQNEKDQHTYSGEKR